MQKKIEKLTHVNVLASKCQGHQRFEVLPSFFSVLYINIQCRCRLYDNIKYIIYMYSNHKFSKMVVVDQNTEIQQFLYNNECLSWFPIKV